MKEFLPGQDSGSGTRRTNMQKYSEMSKEQLVKRMLAMNSMVDSQKIRTGDLEDDDWDKLVGSVRKIGNVGAHMENDVNLIVDITPGEAEKLLKLLEFLIEQWYVNRHERDKLFKEIVDISGEKQSQRAR